MKTKTCRSCRTEIDQRASRCPHCRATQGRPLRGLLGGAFLFLVVAGVVGAAAGGNSGATPSAPAAAVSQATDVTVVGPTAVPVQVVTALTMAQQYDANKIAAETYYKDRIVQTRGIAQDVNQDMLGSYYVSLKPAGYEGWTSLQCDVGSAHDVLSVVKGQPITVRGRVDDMTLGIIPLKDCRVLP